MNESFLHHHKQFLINVTSASGFLGLDDFCAQIFYEKKKFLDDKPCVTETAIGVEQHVWYTFLDRIIAQPIWRNMFEKVLLDQTVAAPIYTATCTSILEGRASLGELKSDRKGNLIPLYIADCLVFIPVQIIHLKYISAYYCVPFMFFIAFIFNTFISAYRHAYEK